MQFMTMHDLGLAEFGHIDPNDPTLEHLRDAWRTFDNNIEQTLGISPGLLDHNLFGRIKRSSNGANTISEVLYDSFRESSVPVEPLMEEVAWPQQLNESQEGRTPPLLRQDTSQGQSSDVQPSTEGPSTPLEVSSSTSQPVIEPGHEKRRRGRPRLVRSLNELSSNPIPESRKTQLEKNRIAAEKCRKRRKEYTTKLLEEVSLLSSRNEALKAEQDTYRNQVLSLKNEVLRHAGCGSSIIDTYIAKNASSRLDVKEVTEPSPARRDSTQEPDPIRIE